MEPIIIYLKEIARIFAFDSNVLFRFCKGSGKVFLLGGGIIFLIWVIGRYLFYYDLQLFELIGFIWAYCGFLICSLNIILLLIYSIIHIRKLHFRILSTLFLILLNIPLLIIILTGYSMIEDKTFVVLENNSKLSIAVQFIQDTSKFNIGNLKPKSSSRFIYQQKFQILDGRKYPQNQKLYLDITYTGGRKKVEFPQLIDGSCYKIIINQDLKLEMSERIIKDITNSCR